MYRYAHAYRYVGSRVFDIAMRDPYGGIYESTIRVMKAQMMGTGWLSRWALAYVWQTLDNHLDSPNMTQALKI